jgi:hypothetical protein
MFSLNKLSFIDAENVMVTLYLNSSNKNEYGLYFLNKDLFDNFNV